MRKYTISDVQEADRLWDQMPLHEVAEEIGIPYGTLRDWYKWDWIDTDVDHRTRAVRKYDSETVRRADRLWDAHPLRKVSDLLGVPEKTLQKWSSRGWINTSTSHHRNAHSDGLDERIRRAAHLVYDRNLMQNEAAEKMGVGEATISRYLKRYRDGACA